MNDQEQVPVQVAPVQNKNKFYAIIAGVSILVLILVAGISYTIGAHSKDDQLKACSETMNTINDVMNYDGEVTSSDIDTLHKCDPSFK